MWSYREIIHKASEHVDRTCHCHIWFPLHDLSCYRSQLCSLTLHTLTKTTPTGHVAAKLINPSHSYNDPQDNFCGQLFNPSKRALFAAKPINPSHCYQDHTHRALFAAKRINSSHCYKDHTQRGQYLLLSRLTLHTVTKTTPTGHFCG